MIPFLKKPSKTLQNNSKPFNNPRKNTVFGALRNRVAFCVPR